MKLSQDEIKHIALLARLGLNEEEIKRYSNQLSSILDYMEILKEVETEGVEPTAQVTGLENVMRDDVMGKSSEKSMKEIIDMAPDHEDNLVKTKSVF